MSEVHSFVGISITIGDPVVFMHDVPSRWYPRAHDAQLAVLFVTQNAPVDAVPFSHVQILGVHVPSSASRWNPVLHFVQGLVVLVQGIFVLTVPLGHLHAVALHDWYIVVPSSSLEDDAVVYPSSHFVHL